MTGLGDYAILLGMLIGLLASLALLWLVDALGVFDMIGDQDYEDYGPPSDAAVEGLSNAIFQPGEDVVPDRGNYYVMTYLPADGHTFAHYRMADPDGTFVHSYARVIKWAELSLEGGEGAAERALEGVVAIGREPALARDGLVRDNLFMEYVDEREINPAYFEREWLELEDD